MRVITGTARGRKLVSPVGYDVRPTSDMAKESVFSILNFDIEDKVFLDLFAGSGQMGIEALSRGAKKAIFIDNSREAQKVIAQNIKLTGFEDKSRLDYKDFKTFLTANREIIDIAFLDPPYNKNIIDEALPLLSDSMSEEGIIVCETDKKEELPQESGDFKIHKVYQYGRAKITVYRRNGGK